MVLFTLSMMSACMGNGFGNSGNGNNADNDSPKAIKDIIPASDLISLEESMVIMEEQMKIDEYGPISMAFTDGIRYYSDNNTLKVELAQEALADMDNRIAQNTLRDGWSAYLEKEQNRIINLLETEHEEYFVIEVNGIGEAAYFYDYKPSEYWALHVFYGEYYFVVSTSKSVQADPASESVRKWYQDKTIEAGTLALDNLKKIIG